MPEQIRLWRVGAGDSLREVIGSKLDLEERLERWLVADISILGSDLMVVGRQIETDYGGIIDLLCINAEGDLVIVELKRDKTPREVTAQVLDYASWVRNLSHAQVSDLADEYLKENGPLEKRFSEVFGVDLPDTLNSGHAMLIVGSSIDDSTERIVQYLSDQYGANINAATFQFYRDNDLGELLARTFLIEPSTVERSVWTKGSSKRKPNLSYEQLESIATEAGVGDLYKRAFHGLNAVFSKGTTQSTAGFAANLNGSRNVMMNLLPFESGQKEGLGFQAYTVRLSTLLGVDRKTVEAQLPDSREPWAYADSTEPFWQGCTGHFTSSDQIDRFVGFLKEQLRRPRGVANG